MTIEQTPAHSEQEEKMPTFSRLHDSGRTVSKSADDIRGRMVKDKNGRNIGKVEHLLIDDGQRVRFMEIASGGFLHLGETKAFIPVEAITRITDRAVHISPTREHVAGAPRYDPNLVLADAGPLLGLYPYYGYQGGFYGSIPPPLGILTQIATGASDKGADGV